MSLPKAAGYDRIGMVARWRPVHNGQAAVVRALCRLSREALVGIGSSNRYNLRNPFTLEETTDMLRLTLEGFDNYRIVPVPDLDDGPRWRELVRALFGPLDLFLTDNPYVAHLLEGVYPLEHPSHLLEPGEGLPLDGTQVRRTMAQGGDWQSLVPTAVAAYILSHRLDGRFRREFGLQTLAMETLVE